jgi:glutamyl-tRNA synthetase
VRTRFAPSPTGDLHLGGAFTALASWWLARSTGGSTVLRVEDLDGPRVVAGAEARQLEDLAWLGLDWDLGPGATDARGPYRQSERTALYDDALAALTAEGRTYPCDCSRAEIARVASAPHEGEEVRYPGTCREKSAARTLKRPAAIRLRVEESDAVAWEDGVVGAVSPALLNAAGDFVLRRGDGVYAYQLAVSADDLAMGIEGVVRGDDLLSSTPRQLLLMHLWRASGALPWARTNAPPRYWHLPLVRDPDRARLAKRTPRATVRELRADGVSAATVVGHLAHGLGLVASPVAMTARELVSRASAGASFGRDAWAMPALWEVTG